MRLLDVQPRPSPLAKKGILGRCALEGNPSSGFFFKIEVRTDGFLKFHGFFRRNAQFRGA